MVSSRSTGCDCLKVLEWGRLRTIQIGRSARGGESGSESDRRKAACAGGSRAQLATRVALTPHAFRLPRTPHEHAHPHALAAREPRAVLVVDDPQIPTGSSLQYLALGHRLAHLAQGLFLQLTNALA